MVSYKKHYAVYVLERSKDRYDPPLKEQLASIFAAYTRRFGVDPAAHFIGPLTNAEGHTLIRAHEVWVEIAPRERMFATAEKSNEENHGTVGGIHRSRNRKRN